jgi:DNA transformation protein and related proteins
MRVFVIDQLSLIRDVTARAMFGGVGIYAGDVFFGILAADVLYFKVDDSNRDEYQEAGMSAFTPYANGAMTMPYYQVPTSVLEHSGSLVAWARRSIAVSRAARKLRKRRRA